MNGGSASSWREPTIRLAAASARASPANERARAAKGVAGELVEEEDLRQRRSAARRPRPRARRAGRARSARRSARGSAASKASSLANQALRALPYSALPGAPNQKSSTASASLAVGVAHRALAPTSRRGWISTERSPSATQTMPSCRLTCSCMLRCASKASSRLCSDGTSQASTLPARPTRPDEPRPPRRRAVAEGVDADPVGAAARLDEAPFLGLADLDPVDEPAGQVLLPELGLVGLPHALGEVERAGVVVGGHVEREGEQADHHPLVGLGRVAREGDERGRHRPRDRRRRAARRPCRRSLSGPSADCATARHNRAHDSQRRREAMPMSMKKSDLDKQLGKKIGGQMKAAGAAGPLRPGRGATSSTGASSAASTPPPAWCRSPASCLPSSPHAAREERRPRRRHQRPRRRAAARRRSTVSARDARIA